MRAGCLYCMEMADAFLVGNGRDAQMVVALRYAIEASGTPAICFMWLLPHFLSW